MNAENVALLEKVRLRLCYFKTIRLCTPLRGILAPNDYTHAKCSTEASNHPAYFSVTPDTKDFPF